MSKPEIIWNKTKRIAYTRQVGVKGELVHFTDPIAFQNILQTIFEVLLVYNLLIISFYMLGWPNSSSFNIPFNSVYTNE